MTATGGTRRQAAPIASLLAATAAEADPEDLALVFPDERLTYAELHERATTYARGLLALGVQPKDHVAILMPNSADLIATFFAVAMAGGVILPVNSRFKSAELGHVLLDGDVRVLLTSETADGAFDAGAGLAEIMPVAGVLEHVVHLGGTERPGRLPRWAFLEAAAGVSAGAVERRSAAVELGDVAMVLYTSGTTAEPKGCVLTHRAVAGQGLNYAGHYGLTAADRFWDPLPLFHVGGLVPLLGSVIAGATYCHPGQFEPGAALEMLERERCTVGMPVFETIWLGVLNHPRFEQTDLSALRMILMIGVPERFRDMQERLPHVVQVNGCGATEMAGQLALGDPEDPLEVRLTHGRVMPGMEVRLVDPETREPVPTGHTGEMLVRGVGLFEGYHKDPELTAQVIDADGWYHTGDLGELDDEGRLFYAGRVKDMLKVGGENVSSLEVENFIAMHPAVNIVQIVGVADARYTEVPAAFIELVPGAQATEADIVGACVGRIATYKVPRYVRFVTSWPMSGTKIKKNALRAQLEAELRDAGITEAPRIVAP